MNDDIVTRLHENCGCSGTEEFGYNCTNCDAADEIERLRALLDNTLERENKDNLRQLEIVRKAEADRDRWVEIAQLWDGAYSAQTYIHGLDEIDTADMARKAQAKAVRGE
jgi:hypothetical protein